MILVGQMAAAQVILLHTHHEVSFGGPSSCTAGRLQGRVNSRIRITGWRTSKALLRRCYRGRSLPCLHSLRGFVARQAGTDGNTHVDTDAGRACRASDEVTTTCYCTTRLSIDQIPIKTNEGDPEHECIHMGERCHAPLEEGEGILGAQ